MNNFPEHEQKNYKVGPYICRCIHCGYLFFGPKRSMICAECTGSHQGDDNG